MSENSGPLRDEMAMRALPHALARARDDLERYEDRTAYYYDIAAREAYAIADAMLRERSK